MTIIAAKQFGNVGEEKKWTLFTDDCITIGQCQVSAARKYRPKLREMSGKNYNLVIASCGGTREIDLILNLLEAKLDISKIKNTMDLGLIIQTTLIEAWKTLQDIAKDPSVGLLILETETNTLWHADDYSLFKVPDGGEIVAGSGEQAFFSANKYEGFLSSLRMAVKTDEYCEFPIYAYRDGKMSDFWPYNSNAEMEEALLSKPISYDCTKGLCNEPIDWEPAGLSKDISTKLG